MKRFEFEAGGYVADSGAREKALRVDSTRRATVRFLIGTAVGAAGALLNVLLWMHSKRPEAPIYTKLCLALLAISVTLAVLRFIWYRKHRNYFAEEMDHRRSLAKGSFRAKS